MTRFIHQLDAGLVKPKTLSVVRCNKTSARVSGTPGSTSRFDHFDCFATYTSGERQPWCVEYTDAATNLFVDYEGPRACEGPSIGILRP